MKRTSLLLSLLIIFSLPTHAQEKNGKGEKGTNVITGKIADSSINTALEYATISLFKKGNEKPIDGTTSNASGHFQLLNIAPGTYKIVAEFMGYKPVTLNNVVVNDRSSVTDLRTIYLERNVRSLQAVVVTAKSKIIDNRIDKMVFNAEKISPRKPVLLLMF